MNALIVDDDDFMRVLTSTLLKQLGLPTPWQAADGATALEIIAAHDIEFVVCDLEMPGMDGIALLRHLAQIENPPSVLIFSAKDRRILATALQLAAAHNLDVLGALAKPPTPESLEPMVNALHERRKVRRAPGDGPAPDRLTPDAIVDGLALGHMVMAFQPQVAVGDGRVVGVEALARWDDPKRGLLGPWAFIGVAERAGLIGELTHRALELSVAQAAEWLAQGHDFTVSVNVTIDDLSDVAFADLVLRLLAQQELAPKRLVLEVTESKIMREVAAPLEVLSRLRLNGVGLALDDYGTGASSMEQLARIPFTELKVDRHFVSHALEDPDARAMLESAFLLADRLELTSLAEGVETQQEWDLVASLGCDRVQGYFVAPPLAAARFEAWLPTWQARHP